MNVHSDPRVTISEASDRKDVEDSQELMLEYFHSLGVNLSFQDIDREMGSFPGEYSPPSGALLIARVGDIPAGCVALRPLEDGSCEMKRLFVRPEFRKLSIGKRLAEAIIRKAKELGYPAMKLDTISELKPALSLYRKLGFLEIPQYRYNPLEGAIFMELKFRS